MSNSRWLFRLRSLPLAALAMSACVASSAALAQTGNAAAGQLLYEQPVNFPVSGLLNCEDCHGPAYLFQQAASASAISGAIGADKGGMSVYSSLTVQQISDISAYVASATPPAPPPPVTPPPASSPAPATPMASPNPAMLPNTVVGGTSGVLNVLFTNTAAVNVTLSTPAIGAASGDSGDFLVAAPTSGTAQCISGRVMAPGTSCSFGVQFSPSAVGARVATWTVNFTGAVTPRTLVLQGSATAASAPAPAPTPSPAPPSAANAPTSGGGGALDLTGLAALAGLVGLAIGRRRVRR
jgi:hypothetical protein